MTSINAQIVPLLLPCATKIDRIRSQNSSLQKSKWKWQCGCDCNCKQENIIRREHVDITRSMSCWLPLCDKKSFIHECEIDASIGKAFKTMWKSKRKIKIDFNADRSDKYTWERATNCERIRQREVTHDCNLLIFFFFRHFSADHFTVNVQKKKRNYSIIAFKNTFTWIKLWFNYSRNWETSTVL